MDSDAKSVRERKRAITFMYFVVCLFYFLKAYSSHLVFYGAGRGGDVLPDSPNPDPILDQKMSFSTPVFRPGGGLETQHYEFT